MTPYVLYVIFYLSVFIYANHLTFDLPKISRNLVDHFQSLPLV